MGPGEQKSRMQLMAELTEEAKAKGLFVMTGAAIRMFPRSKGSIHALTNRQLDALLNELRRETK